MKFKDRCLKPRVFGVVFCAAFLIGCDSQRDDHNQGAADADDVIVAPAERPAHTNRIRDKAEKETEEFRQSARETAREAGEAIEESAKNAAEDIGRGLEKVGERLQEESRE